MTADDRTSGAGNAGRSSSSSSDDLWIVIPVIDGDGTIRSSRVVREIEADALAARTVAIEVVVPLGDPDDVGEPGGKLAVKKLDEQGERLANAFGRHELLDVCRTIETDQWRWLGYALPTVVDQVAERAGKVFHRFPAALQIADDPDGSRFEQVRPDDEERQTGNDVLVLTQLATAGDDRSVARPLDHVIECGDPNIAAALAAALEGVGFEVAVIDGTVECRRAATPVLPALRHERADIFAQMASFDGVSYRGWGCDVVPLETANIGRGSTTHVRRRWPWRRRS